MLRLQLPMCRLRWRRLTLRRVALFTAALAVSGAAIGCSPFTLDPVPGPDKQAVGTYGGAALGAVSGGVIEKQLYGSITQGSFIGAAFGAIYGLFSGLGVDLLEEDALRRFDELRKAREMAWVQEVLAEHYARRLELHPNRDIFPADWFFETDHSELRPEAVVLAQEVGKLAQRRAPWSRIVITAYVTTPSHDSTYAQYLSKKRAQEIALQFIRAGVEPRRVLTESLTIDQPILIDPEDHPDRYRQAIEIVAVDN